MSLRTLSVLALVLSSCASGSMLRGVNVSVFNATNEVYGVSVVELPGGDVRHGYAELRPGAEGAVAFAVEDGVAAVRPVFWTRESGELVEIQCAEQSVRSVTRFSVRLARSESGAFVCESAG